MKKEAELYFIQFLFIDNRDLLLKEFRPLYDALFKKYYPIYSDGRKQKMDLIDILTKFKKSL
jgi:hypothetical protein